MPMSDKKKQIKTESGLKSIKVDRNSYKKLKTLVYVKYNMETYKNLRQETTLAIERHCQLLLSQLTPEMRNKYEILMKGVN